MARLKASTVPRSSLGAPALTATPMPARAKSTRMPTTLPLLMRSSITGGFNATMSAGPPASTLAITFAAKTALTLLPVALWNPAARSCSPEMTPMPPTTVISAALAVPWPGTPSTARQAAASPFIHFVMTPSRLFCVSHAICEQLAQSLAGSTWVLCKSGAASGVIMNLIIARAASGSFEPAIRATLEGQGTFLRLLRARHQGDARGAGHVQEAGQCPDIFGARGSHHDVGLLDADFEVAFGQELDHRAAVAVHRLGLELIGEAELRYPFGRMGAAAAVRIADRLCGQQCRLVGLRRADVRLGHAGAYRKTETGEHERRHGAGHHLASLDEILDRGGIAGDQVRGPAGSE